MRLSSERLYIEAEASQFRPEVLEKVAHLLELLNRFREHPLLQRKLVLKGGTALNLFVLDVPRLSVDIDLNYIGAADREAMLQERPHIESALQAIFTREGYTVRRMPEEHAGGKWSLRYPGALGQEGNLEVDINYMYRIPLWPVVTMDSRFVGRWRATSISVLELHELAAGKLAALFARGQARDLFDCHQILTTLLLDQKQLRIAFVVYGAMNRMDWRTVSIDELTFDESDLANHLVPTLRGKKIQGGPTAWGRVLVEECRQALSVVVPFRENELEFLDRILEAGDIEPYLLTNDPVLQQTIRQHPMLLWKAHHVREHKGQG